MSQDIAGQLNEVMKQLAVMEAQQKSDQQQIADNKSVIAQIHRLSVNMEHMTKQMDKLVESFDNRMRSQGERLGNLESLPASLKMIVEKIESISNSQIGLDERLKKIETKGSKRWESVVEKIVLGIVATGLLYVMARIGFY